MVDRSFHISTPNGLKSILLRGLSLNRLEVLNGAGAAKIREVPAKFVVE
jgi:hypothetical protein